MGILFLIFLKWWKEIWILKENITSSKEGTWLSNLSLMALKKDT